VGWHPLIHGADHELLQSFEEPGSGTVVRFIALYRLHAIGNALTRNNNRIVDEREWQLEEQGHSEVSIGGNKVRVTASHIARGPYRRLVWSFYLVDGKITSGLIETKLLQARAMLLHHASFAAFVAVSASRYGRPRDQLERFLLASQPSLQSLARLTLGNVANSKADGPN